MEEKGEKIEVCPVCGSKVYLMYGCGWDYDKLICAYRGCGWEYELMTTTYPEDNKMTNINAITTIYKCKSCNKYTAIYGIQYETDICPKCDCNKKMWPCSSVNPAIILERILNGDPKAIPDLKEFEEG